ncbi:hypothetical protein GGI02_001990 [Coemansia sp. RSA 2322]|nr:hypothetical protein GGI02_001990 [Coemansia sp. RSA 2322]
MSGSPRQRLQLVLVQLHHLLDSAPRIYEILDRKRMIEGSAAAQSHAERGLNSLWRELKVRCSLLVLDKDTSQNTVTKSPLREPGECTDKVTLVQALVASAIVDAIEHGVLLWALPDASVRGLLLIDAGKESLTHMLLSVQDQPVTFQRMLGALVEAYEVLPDMYKLVVKTTMESAALSSPNNVRLVIEELQRHRVLPSVLFRALAEYARLTARITEVRRYLDSLFHIGSESWIGTGSGPVKPKYAVHGDEIRKQMYSHFELLDEHSQRRDLRSYIRAVSGLIGYLRLEVSDSDYAFSRHASRLALDEHAVDACAALSMVLVGFGSYTTAQDTFTAFSGTFDTPAADLATCLLVHLKTNNVKEVDSFAARVLDMDFAYPRDRLYLIKDAAEQTKDACYSNASVARRLIAWRPADAQRDSLAQTLRRDAVLCCLRAGLFQRCGVDVREWITQAIFAVDAVNASNLGCLVKAYVDAVFTSASTTPVPESLLWRAFASESIVDDTGSRVSPPQVLFLLYLLYYYERTMGQPISGGVSYHTHFPKREPVDLPMSNGIMSRSSASGELLSTLSGRTNTVHSSASSQPGASGPGLISGTPGIVRRGEYSEQLLDSLPVAWILQRVSKCVEYSLLWPELLSMATTQFPDQLETVSVLQCELAANAAHATLQPSHAEFPALTLEPGTGTASWQTREAHLLSRITPRNSIFGESAQSILHAAENFEKLPIASRMKECSSFAEHMCCAALRHSQDAELTACVRQAWFALHSLNPHLVSTATINAWRGASETLKPALVPQDMWLDPLVILRSDARVFQSGSLVEIILTVLSQFLELSKTSMRRIYALRQRDSGALKKAHLSAIIQLQETSTIQALIEIARFVTGSDARSLIFGFIHARFLEQRTTQKLLHFQAYDAAAIGDMVDNVPSMHACSEFIPELLMQSAPRLQLFAIKLATAVLSTYPIAANEGMAREVILPHISTTLVQLVGTDNAEQLAICNAMFEAVVTIGSAFSLTRDECKRLADTVKEAAEDRTRGALSAATPLHAQGYAKWIRCCENVLAELRSPRASADGSGAFTSIENIDASEIVARLEKSPVADRKGHLGRGGSPGPQPPEMSSSQPAAAGGQQQAASMRPPGSLGPPLHQAHQQGQHAASSGIHKRPHSTIADERGSRSTVSASAMAGHETNGSAPDFGRGRGPTGGAVGSRAPSTASETSVDSSGAQGGPKRRNRHRHRFGGKDDAPRPPGLGPKRNKAPAGDRSRG